MSFAPSKLIQRARICNIRVSNSSEHIQIKIKMPNPSQEPPANTKASNQELMDMDVLCTFKSKIVSQNLENGCTKSNGNIQIKIKIANHSQEPIASSKTPNLELKDKDVRCTLKIQIRSQNSEYGCFKDQQLYKIQDSDAKSKSGNSSVLQSPK